MIDDNAQFEKVPAVRFQRLLPGPVERIWSLLADPNHLPGWFGDAVIEPRTGGAVKLMGGHVRGTVTRCDPPRFLTYTWNVFGPGEEASQYPESYVTFELEHRGADVLLTLTHLPVLERFEKQNAMGWHTFLDMLSAVVHGETPQSREHYMTQNAARYGVDLANLTR